MVEIDLKKAEKEFETYTDEFLNNNSDELNRDKILLKIKHTYRVKELCIQIAKSLGLDDEQIKF